MYSFGYVGVIGRPNAGKSTLVNVLVGQKVAIVSAKPQTTRDNIMGIMNGKNYQVALVDTPGVHHSKNKLDKFMIKNVRGVLAGVDVVVYLVDGTAPVDDEEKDYIEKLKKMDAKLLLVKTKKDKPSKCELDCDFYISSLTGEGVMQLKSAIIDALPKSKTKNFLYDQDEYTDKSLRFIAAEQIREQCLNLFKHEIPHGIAVDITSFKEGDDLCTIEAEIICERASHKGIIIGKGGQTLKKIGVGARTEIERIMGKKVMLKLFVKVEENWRDKPDKLKNLGYK